jgi:hypothetical protein
MADIIRIEGKWYRVVKGIITIIGTTPKPEKVQEELKKLIEEGNGDEFTNLLAVAENLCILTKERLQDILNYAIERAGLV